MDSQVNNQEIDSLFEHLPIEIEKIIDVPSKCKFYSGCTGIKLRPMNLEDEKALAISKGKSEDPINVVLSRCVDGINIQDLLLIDKLSILFNLRAISYGDVYSTITICPACEHQNKLDVKLTELPINYVPEEFTDPREITLPVLNKKVKVIFPRINQEVYLRDRDKIFDNIWRFVVSIDGKIDKVLISKFLSDKRLPLRDVHAIINAIAGMGYGVNTSVKYKCSKCGENNVLDMPIGPDFFTMS